MYSVVGNTTSLVLGFPIRTSSDQRSVGSSPRHIAASNVLHRLPVPRHPPCALKHLQHKNQKMSFKRNCTSMTHKKATPTRRPAPHILRARCSQPLSTNQTPHPTTKVRQQHADTRNREPPPEEGTGLLSQSPIVCPMIFRRCFPASHAKFVECTRPPPTTGARPSNESPESSADPAIYGAGPGLVVLLRKEVIQPHLPVRLPCYDFVPIADPTFDGSLHKG